MLEDMDTTSEHHHHHNKSSSVTLSSSMPTLLPATTSPKKRSATITSTAAADSSSNAEESILFAETSTVNHNKLKRRGPLMESRISNTLGSLGENMRKMTSASSSRLAEKLLNSTESFGSFIMWMPEPSLPSRYSGSIEMPSREIQLALIDQFFNERHESLAMMIRYHFYEQLETKGLMITPLLLNIIYAHAARFLTLPGCPKTEVFYHRARRLVDDFMDVPRVSTVVALCLLSLYEPSPAIYRPGAHHCRQWQYSGMAFRMAIELGLHSDNNVHSSLTPVEVELRRRVFWACYELDKFQSAGWERPWMISREISRTTRPSILPEESEDDAHVLAVSNAKICFINIVEENLILLTASQAFVGGNNGSGSDLFLGIHKDNILSSINDNHAKHQNWLRSLRPSMQWTPISTISVKDVLDLPAPRPMVGHLHLYYNTLTLALIERIPSTSVTQFQARVTSACMTQLCHHLCQTPSYIIKFDFIAHALIHAIKIHIRYLDDPDVNLAQQAWLLFDRSIWCMQLITGYAVIPNCTKFLQQVQNIYGLHMSSDGSNSSPSPITTAKKHQRSVSALGHAPASSTVDPSPATPILQQQQQQQQTGLSLTAGNTAATSSNNSNRILDSVQFPDDISQILTDWTSSPSSNDRSNSILQLDSTSRNNNNNMVYMNTSQQMHPHYNQFNATAARQSQPTPPPPQQQQQQQHNIYATSSYTHHNPHHHQQQQHPHQHQRSHSANQLPIWTAPNARYNTNDAVSYSQRDIVVPSQLDQDTAPSSSSTENNNTPGIMFQQQQQQQQARYTGGQNDWQPQQHETINTMADGTTGDAGKVIGKHYCYDMSYILLIS